LNLIFSSVLSKRPIFNWAHRIVGNLALIFGIASIFLAFGYDSLNLPLALAYALVIWVVIYFVVQLVLSLQQCLSHKNEEEEEVQGVDESGSSFRKVIALIFILFLWAFAIAFVVVIARA
jgi:hypothetical protein